MADQAEWTAAACASPPPISGIGRWLHDVRIFGSPRITGLFGVRHGAENNRYGR
jgi:hypothetical protein